MRYWNQDNFKGLEDTGHFYKDKKDFENFAIYCLEKAKGLRKKSLDALHKFIAHINTMNFERQKEIVLELIYLKESNRQITKLFAHPLLDLSISTMKKWESHNPQAFEPKKWLGYLLNHPHYFEQCLKINPKDQLSNISLAQIHLNDIDFQCHHLYESIFIGSIQSASRSLEKSIHLIHMLEDSKKKRSLIHEHQYLTKLINSWKIYSSMKLVNKPFHEWSKENGEHFNFNPAIYYDH